MQFKMDNTRPYAGFANTAEKKLRETGIVEASMHYSLAHISLCNMLHGSYS